MRTLADVPWSTWKPTDDATLLFVIDRSERRVLLIEKKRGLGAGKVNAPGGRLEPGERPIDAAVREVREEVGVDALAPEEMGELSFQFTDGYALHCTVFRSHAWRGEPRETDEASPFWASLDALPFDRMWADDRVWLPHVIAGRRFRGRAVFDGDTMLDHEIVVDT
jgi:8-oxo-dGTP diphosphatase